MIIMKIIIKKITNKIMKIIKILILCQITMVIHHRQKKNINNNNK